MNANIRGIIIIIFGFVYDYWFIDSLDWVVHPTKGIEHNDVNFNSKLGLLSNSFLGQPTYCFES